jgi:hypothetical protein
MRVNSYSTGSAGYGLIFSGYSSNYVRNTLYDYIMFINARNRPGLQITLGKKNPYLFSMR